MSIATYRAPRRDLALLWHQVRYEQLAAWGAAGAVVAILRFRWDPRPE